LIFRDHTVQHCPDFRTPLPDSATVARVAALGFQLWWPSLGAKRWSAVVGSPAEWSAEERFRRVLSTAAAPSGAWLEGRTLGLAGAARHGDRLLLTVRGGRYSDHLALGRGPRTGPDALPAGAPGDPTIGVSALVRLADGRIPLLVQSPQAVASPGRLVPSASGSASPVGPLWAGQRLEPRAWAEAELREELGLPPDVAVRLRPWALLYDVRTGGKPELLFLGAVAAPAAALRIGPEHTGVLRLLPPDCRASTWACLARDRAAARVLRVMATLLSAPGRARAPRPGAPGCRRPATVRGGAAPRRRRGGG